MNEVNRAKQLILEAIELLNESSTQEAFKSQNKLNRVIELLDNPSPSCLIRRRNIAQILQA